jgi:4-hydroxy-tetrahydrodipicolinate reductase
VTGELRVAVLGAAGRMGAEVCRAVESAPDLRLVASVDQEGAPADCQAAGAEVVVDFTRPDVVMTSLADVISRGMHAVVGTSGFDESRLGQVSEWLKQAPGVGAVVAPNFALGAVLMMRFARQAAPWFESVEVVELHHPDKVDAPSGTAIRTAEEMAAARAAAGVPNARLAAAAVEGPARGASVAGVPVHSVRLRGLVAHQEVLLGNVGETLTLRHDSSDRSSFMPGVLAAVRAVPSRPGLTVGLEAVLGLDAR